MSENQTDWKDKYLASLDKQERRERQQQQIMSLLMRAVVRISLVADGVDTKLDKQLAGLRQLLREGSPSGRDLNTVVDALEGQVKRLDTVKSERATVITRAFQSLVAQLQKIKPEEADSKELKKLNKSIKQRSGLIQEYSALINEYAAVQRSVLQDSGELRISKPFWHKWQDEGVEKSPEQVSAVQEVAAKQAPLIESSPEVQHEPSEQKEESSAVSVEQELTAYQESIVKQAAVELIDKAAIPESAADDDGLELSGELTAPSEQVGAEASGKEPPFSRLNIAICEILTELLAQIEPPALAKDNYQSACQRLAKGLNWYELVPTLEDISMVVVSAFDSHQKDFEHFLTQMNERLSEAYTFISASEKVSDQGREAGRRLSESMREQVSAIQHSVESAAELDQLKTEVSARLDQIVAVMDNHQSDEQQRDNSLSEQLDALVEKVKVMESASEDAEQRIEEQRQKALRDVLTQLPNREAYQQRLEQEFERWQRYDRPLTMVICDIDHFKRINDNYGHLAGDKVLRIIAKSLRKRLRKTDFIARVGGEEFVILMPETELQQALKVAEGVREAIASCPFHFKEQPVSITLSFGISVFSDGDLPDQVFARADKALYEAKDKGRNRCVMAEQ